MFNLRAQGTYRAHGQEPLPAMAMAPYVVASSIRAPYSLTVDLWPIMADHNDWHTVLVAGLP